MRKRQRTERLDAFALFPDLMQSLSGAVQKKEGRKGAEPAATKSGETLLEPPKSCLLPPRPPDLSWLREGGGEERERVEDIPTALVLMGNGEKKQRVVSDLQELGYRPEGADTAAEAFVLLKTCCYAAIVLHVNFEAASFAESSLHNYLRWLPPAKRRALFYVLVGPDLHTLYNLEALSLSANLVINDLDVTCLKTILQRSFRDHEELFGPLVEVLSEYGRV